MTTKPLYLLIKLDVDGDVVFTYEEAEKYAQNFCNSLEFELIDHCLEEEENKDLYIGSDDLREKVEAIEDRMEEFEDLCDERGRPL
jgi:predicted Rossmann-fold nucleotide-binding protein